MKKPTEEQQLEAAAVKGGGLTTPDDVPTGRDLKKAKPAENPVNENHGQDD